MDSLENNNIKSEQVCRTCLIDEGHFFNISDTFDHYTLTQMIQNITNLQVNSSDGYTQSICFECVKEMRKAHTFRQKCLESNNILIKMKVDIESIEFPISIYKSELPKIEEIKKEVEDCSNINDFNLESEDDYKSDNDDSDDEAEFDYDEDKDFKSHKPEDRSKIIFDCPLCHGLFSNVNTYKKHIKALHPDRLQDECFIREREPLGHILKKKLLKKMKNVYKCVLDEFLGNSFVEFKNHMKEHTGEKPVVCIDCGYQTAEIYQLKAHRLQKHVEEKRFSCSCCEYSCQSKYKLKIHLATHSTEKQYKCELCSLTFSFPSGLSAHQKAVHEKKKPHACSICEKAFFRSSRLRDHMRTHTGERPHICHYCGWSFSRAENMKHHVALQHEPIKTLFNCDQCDYSTKHKTEFKLHKMRHKGEKPFMCSQCPFSALLKSSLKKHLMRHSGEKNFACDLCDYKAISPNLVKQHRSIHTGEKPYSCNICNHSSRTQQGFKRHMQTHSSEQKFECPNCPYKTNANECLRRHLKKNCVIKKKGRPSTKFPNVILKNHKIKEDISIEK